MIWTDENQSTQEKPVPMPPCQPGLLHGLAEKQTELCVVKDWQLTTWNMAWPMDSSVIRVWCCRTRAVPETCQHPQQVNKLASLTNWYSLNFFVGTLERAANFLRARAQSADTFQRILSCMETWVYKHHIFDHTSWHLSTRGKLRYLAPLGSENISASYFKQCFFQVGVLPPRLSQTPCLPVPRQK